MSEDININESAILETLNAKIDYDGGNYKGSGLANYVVDKSGDTMTGVLNIEHNTWGSLILKNSNIDINTPPSAKQFMGMDFRDNGGNRLGFFGIQQDTTGETFITFQAQKSKGILAPTPATGDNSTKIATTAFVKSVLSSSGSGFATISKNDTGYCKFNNGLIIQWGRVSVGNTSKTTVTLPVAFTSTNYKVSGNIYSTTATSQKNDSAYNYTTTTFDLFNGQGGTCDYDWIAVGY